MEAAEVADGAEKPEAAEPPPRLRAVAWPATARGLPLWWMIRFQMAADYLCILLRLAVLTSRLSSRPERSGKARRAAVVLIGRLEL